MAENAGRIEYEFIADTTSILKAEALLNKSNTNMVKSFDAADKAVNRFMKSQKEAGNTINKAGQVMDANGRILVQQTQQYRTLETQAVKSLVKLKQQSESTFTAASTTADLLKKNLESMADKSIKKLNSAMSESQKIASNAEPRMTRVATAVRAAGASANKSSFQMTNLSYQIQDVAVQAQMGTNAFIIMGQQLPQMLVGMGAGAAAIGALIAILGGLATALIKSKSPMVQFEKAVEQVKATMTLGADGVVNYADELKELNKVSQQLAKIKLAEAILNQNEVIKNSSKLIVESAEKTSKAYKSTFAELRNLAEGAAKDIGGDMNDVAKAVKGDALLSGGGYLNTALDRIAGKFKITRSEALDLGLAMSDVIKKGDAVSIKSLQNVTEDLAAAYGYSNDKITKLASGMVKYFISTNQATDGINELRMALFDSGQAIDENTSKTGDAAKAASDLALSMIEQKVALEQGERAALSFRLQLDGVDEAEKQHILTLFDANQATKKNKEEIDAATAANKQYEESVRKKTESDLAWFEQQERWLKGQEKKETESNITFAQGIINKGKSPEEQMGEQYERLKKLRDTDLENAQLYQEAMTSLEQQAMESREAMWSESYQRIGQQAADSMADYLTGVETAEDATRMLASTIVSEVIQSLVQMGLSAITQSMTTTAATTTGIATTTGAAVASTGVMATAQGTAMATVAGAVGTIAGGLATAWAPAAAFASLATLGTNAAPAIAGIYSTMAATLGAQLVGGIASNAITAGTGFNGTSGGRQYGGPVSNGMYRVNETGIPEVYSQGGKDYLMNTKNANVTPLDKAQGGGGGMSVEVNNYTPYQVYVTRDEAAGIAKVEIGNESKKASQGRGVMYQGLSKGTNVKNNARR